MVVRRARAWERERERSFILIGDRMRVVRDCNDSVEGS